MKISFEEFCIKQSLSGNDTYAFKSWLGKEINTRKFEHEWLSLWTEFLRSRLEAA